MHVLGSDAAFSPTGSGRGKTAGFWSRSRAVSVAARGFPLNMLTVDGADDCTVVVVVKHVLLWKNSPKIHNKKVW